MRVNTPPCVDGPTWGLPQCAGTERGLGGDCRPASPSRRIRLESTGTGSASGVSCQPPDSAKRRLCSALGVVTDNRPWLAWANILRIRLSGMGKPGYSVNSNSSSASKPAKRSSQLFSVDRTKRSRARWLSSVGFNPSRWSVSSSARWDKSSQRSPRTTSPSRAPTVMPSPAMQSGARSVFGTAKRPNRLPLAGSPPARNLARIALLRGPEMPAADGPTYGLSRMLRIV
jgi:hypothetical protein